MKTEAFDYALPHELIAQKPVLPRESCRLLVLNRETQKLEDKHFFDILSYLDPGDLLVVNDTKVMPARLLGQKEGMDALVEILLLHRMPELDDAGEMFKQHWEALVKPGRRLKPGSCIFFGSLRAQIVNWVGADAKGRRIVCLESQEPLTVEDAITKQGKLPLPPYIHNYSDDTSLYQTVYAHRQNSAAAPTAGLHFSHELLARLQAQGCEFASVCLEIGLDTFRKVEETRIEDHQIHTEIYSVSAETLKKVHAAKERGSRVVAVGTTAVRALESTASKTQGLRAVERERTSLYITPGYDFKIVDALITNFHTPRSTLMMLVSAFAGHDAIMEAYAEAIRKRYRFLSFGDAMLIV